MAKSRVGAESKRGSVASRSVLDVVELTTGGDVLFGMLYNANEIGF